MEIIGRKERNIVFWALTLANIPGVLRSIAEVFAKYNVNILSGLLHAPPESREAVWIVATDFTKALKKPEEVYEELDKAFFIGLKHLINLIKIHCHISLMNDKPNILRFMDLEDSANALRKLLLLIVLFSLQMLPAFLTSSEPYTTQYYYLDKVGIEIWVTHPITVDAGSTCTIEIEIKPKITYGEIRVYVTIFNGRDWSSWLTVFKGFIPGGTVKKSVIRITIPSNAYTTYTVMWFYVQAVPFTILGQTSAPIDYDHVVFIGPYVKGSDYKRLLEENSRLRKEIEEIRNRYSELLSRYENLRNEAIILKEKLKKLEDIEDKYNALYERYRFLESIYLSTLSEVNMLRIIALISIITAAASVCFAVYSWIRKSSKT